MRIRYFSPEGCNGIVSTVAVHKSGHVSTRIIAPPDKVANLNSEHEYHIMIVIYYYPALHSGGDVVGQQMPPPRVLPDGCTHPECCM